MALQNASPDVLQAKLRELFRKAKMPSSPALAAQILALVEDPDSNASDFGRILRTDPALATRLLKTANSAQFAQRNPVTTIERAVTVLGLNRVKTVSLGFQLVNHLDRLGGTSFDWSAFWQQALLRACLARSVAHQSVPDRQEEAFLIGLLQDCGVVLLVQILGSDYASLYGRDLSPAALYRMEQEGFPYTHVDVIEALCKEWQLPDLMVAPLTTHHQRVEITPRSTEADRLAAVSYFVGGLCFVPAKTPTIESDALREYGGSHLGLEPKTWQKNSHSAITEYRHLSALYGDFIAEDTDVVDLLDQANRQLYNFAQEVDRRLVDTEAERDHIKREQQRQAGALREYRERAALDPLTHLLNRGALTEVAGHAIECDREADVAIAVLLIDLDDFKLVNDEFGHIKGDCVLKAVSAHFERVVGEVGVVGRYGGEEFVIILRGVDETQTREIAEAVVRGVRELDPAGLGLTRPVTCSAGGYWCAYVPEPRPDALFARADRLMYKAKRDGKDRVCFECVDEPRDRQAIEADPTPLRVELFDDRSPSDSPFEEGEYNFLAGLARQLNATDAMAPENVRKQLRTKVVVPCVLRHFAGSGTELRVQHAVTRNITKGGVGLVASYPLERSEAVEIALDQVHGRQFLAGLISFCREVEENCFDIGMQFIRCSLSPIISGNVNQALKEYDWLAQALAAKRSHEPSTLPVMMLSDRS